MTEPPNRVLAVDEDEAVGLETTEGSPAYRPKSAVDLVFCLQRFAALHADGVLTDEEFAAVKSRLLGA